MTARRLNRAPEARQGPSTPGNSGGYSAGGPGGPGGPPRLDGLLTTSESARGRRPPHPAPRQGEKPGGRSPVQATPTNGRAAGRQGTCAASAPGAEPAEPKGPPVPWRTWGAATGKAPAVATLPEAPPIPAPPRLRGSVPGYVRACHGRKWHLRVWKKGGRPGDYIRAPYFCRSWRHPGKCAATRSGEDFGRIFAALGPYPAEHVVFAVLTVKPTEWKDEAAAYEGLRDCWRSFAKAVRREWGEMVYVSTVEKTRRGWPHLNVIMVSPGLGESLEEMPAFVLQWFKDHADACGFGNQVFLERARTKQQVAGYVVKLADMAVAAEAAEGEEAPDLDAVRKAGEHTARSGKTVGEVVKLSQLPRNAPKGFRRLRASPRFLPPPPKNEEWTGELEKMPHPSDLDEERRAELGRFDEELQRAYERAECRAGAVWHPPPGVTWDSHAQPPPTIILDVQGPPPTGEEWVDGAWEELERRRAEVLRGIREQLQAVQGELF